MDSKIIAVVYICVHLSHFVRMTAFLIVISGFEHPSELPENSKRNS